MPWLSEPQHDAAPFGETPQLLNAPAPIVAARESAAKASDIATIVPARMESRNDFGADISEVRRMRSPW
jgi:hypothetical protein